MVPRLRTLPYALVLILLVPLLAGCTAPTPDQNETDDDGTSPPERRWENPYAFDIHFDGGAAYDLALQQIYEDPEAKTGPRYRIPGTETHQEVAGELLAHLDDAMKGMGGRASMSRFTGDRYYDLDLTPVEPYVANCEDGARERVRGIEFVNIVGRTSASDIGVIIGAHWDSKRHADYDPDPANHDEPFLAADDGAAGTAAVIELARAFAADTPDIPLTFILFDGEDGFARADCHPLAGSLHYAQSLSAQEKETVHGLILLDMVGNVSASFYREGNSRSYQAPSGTVRSEWMIDLVWETAAEMGVGAFKDRSIGGIIDDHIPFLHEGIHAIDIIRYEGRFAEYWHTTADDHTVIQPEGLDQVGAVVEASLRRYAEDPEAFRQGSG